MVKEEKYGEHLMRVCSAFFQYEWIGVVADTWAYMHSKSFSQDCQSTTQFS